MKPTKVKALLFIVIIVIVVSGGLLYKRYNDFVVSEEVQQEMIGGLISFHFYEFVRNHNRRPQTIAEVYPENLVFENNRDSMLTSYMLKYYQILNKGDSICLVKTPFGTDSEAKLYDQSADSDYTFIDFLSNKSIVLWKWPKLEMPCDYNYIWTSWPYFYASPTVLQNDSVFKQKVSKLIYKSIYQCYDSSSVKGFPNYRGNYLVQVVSTSEGYKASYICRNDTFKFSNKVLTDIELRFDSIEIQKFDTIIKQVHKFVEENIDTIKYTDMN